MQLFYISKSNLMARCHRFNNIWRIRFVSTITCKYDSQRRDCSYLLSPAAAGAKVAYAFTSRRLVP